VKEENPVTDVLESPDLLAETCIACRRDAPRVTEEEMIELRPLILDWELQDHNGVPRLVRTFRVPNFRDALAFTQQVGQLAEGEGHHPAILTEWGKVTVSWWTHKIRGLHRNDFIMAAKTDALAHEAGVLEQADGENSAKG
jgi:4a-hydroxytetrahydrobiopterin dehydratase